METSDVRKKVVEMLDHAHLTVRQLEPRFAADRQNQDSLFTPLVVPAQPCLDCRHGVQAFESVVGILFR